MSRNSICNMNEYLKTTIEKLRSAEYCAVHAVLGNESCDLDSAVSALVYAFFLHWQHQRMKCRVCTRDKRTEPIKDEIFLAVLNAERQDYQLKTEVVYCLEQHGIHKDNLLFRDDPEVEAALSQADITLVDHHVLSAQDVALAPLVREVIDHRPAAADWRFRPDTRATLHVTGSCATLVTRRVRELSALFANETDFFTDNVDCCDMLHSTIILDTVNFSKELEKGTPDDEEELHFLEGILAPADCQGERSRKLSALVAARGAVHALEPALLLRKDAKLLHDLLVPSLPLLVHEFLSRPGAVGGVVEAVSRRGVGGAVLLGVRLQGAARRDLALYCTRTDRRDRLCSFLLEWKPSFELSEEPLDDQSADRSLRYFRQLNLSATRKQYMPALHAFLALE